MVSNYPTRTRPPESIDTLHACINAGSEENKLLLSIGGKALASNIVSDRAVARTRRYGIDVRTVNGEYRG